MSINNIGDYLERFKKMEPMDARVKRAVESAFRIVMGHEIESDQMRVSKKTLYVHVHPTFRAEIHLHKNKLLHAIEAQLGEKIIEDIV